MGLTVTIGGSEKTVFGNRRAVFADVAFDSSYPTGGEALTPETLGLRTIDFLVVENASGYTFEYDRTNEKLKAFAGGGQAAHTHDLLYIGGITATEPVAIDGGDTLGKNAATNRTIAGADVATKGGVQPTTATIAAASEVANTTDLSALTAVRLLAIGK